MLTILMQLEPCYSLLVFRGDVSLLICLFPLQTPSDDFVIKYFSFFRVWMISKYRSGSDVVGESLFVRLSSQ